MARSWVAAILDVKVGKDGAARIMLDDIYGSLYRQAISLDPTSPEETIVALAC